MTETNEQDIRFALVDEAGHLTGKPAEGVQAAIAQAVAAIPTPEAAWSQADFDKAMNAHYENLMKVILASTMARSAIGSPTTSFWGNTAWAGTPEVFRRIIEKIADMQNIPPWSKTLFDTLMGEYPEIGEPLQLLLEHYQTNEDTGFIDFVSRDSEGLVGFVVDLFVAHHALKLMGVDKLEVVGDNLRVTKDGRTGSVPITWDAA